MDPLRRVSVVGVSGSGKTTLGARLAHHLGVPHLELDALHHLPGWEPIDPLAFRRQVAGFVAGDRWVVDGNYPAVRDLVWQRADTVVVLDYPRWLVMRRVVLRSLRRVLTREPLWNDNRESLGKLLKLHRPEESVVAWAWTRHRSYRELYRKATRDPRWSHLRFVVVRHPRQATSLLTEVV